MKYNKWFRQDLKILVEKKHKKIIFYCLDDGEDETIVKQRTKIHIISLLCRSKKQTLSMQAESISNNFVCNFRYNL